MKRVISELAIVTWLASQTALSQSLGWQCQTIDTSSSSHMSRLVNVTQPLILILVDFPEGRKPDGSLPTVDADTIYFPGDLINSVGAMGWANPPDYQKKIRKYVYEDYWDMIFSSGEYTGTKHPDYSTHQGYIPLDAVEQPYDLTVYGSVKDYYHEATYGNVEIQAYPTRSGSGKLYSGIVNRIDTAGGKNYVRWVKLPHSRSFYDSAKAGLEPSPIDRLTVIQDALRYVDTLHYSRSTTDPDYIEFAIHSYPDTGKIGIVAAGGEVFGYADHVGGQSYIVPEKTYGFHNTSRSAILDGITTQAHEFGHTLGLDHILGGSYELMHWGTLGSRRYYWCPPHFSPWVKLMMGWIPPGNIIKVNRDSSISLSAITNSPNVALVAVYGDPGRGSDYGHSEYLMIEYRKREGFNRFAGGSVVADTSFHGGALVWVFSRDGLFPSNDDLYKGGVSKNLGLKVEGYGPGFKGDPGDPSHFYPKHGTSLDPSSNPNSSSVEGLTTGISLNNFAITNGMLNFRVNYQLSPPPSYSIVYGVDSLPTNLSGRVFVEHPINLPTHVSPGTVLDFAVGQGVVIEDQKFVAVGGSTSSDSIIFQGVGYGQNRVTWGTYIDSSLHPGISFFPPSAPDSFRIQKCIIKDAINGVGLVLWSYTNNWIRPVVQGNRISGTTADIVFRGKFYPTGAIPDISGFDDNSFWTFLLQGNSVLSAASQFTVPSNALLRFEETWGPGSSSPSRIQMSTGKSLVVNGQFTTYRRTSLSGGTLTLNKGGTIQGGSTFTVESGTNVNLGSPADVTVQTGGALRLLSGVQIAANSNNSLIVNGRLAALGTPSSRITLSAPSSSWYAISLTGGGPDTMTYCDIKNLYSGLTLTNTAPESYMQDDTLAGTVNGDAVTVSNTSTADASLRMLRCVIEQNDYRGMVVGNAKVYLTHCRIEANNGASSPQSAVALSVGSGAKVYLDSCRLQNDGGYGISVSGYGSRFSLSPDEVSRGYNTLYNHGLGEINVANSATAFLGYDAGYGYCDCGNEYSVHPAGNNQIFATGCGPGCTYVYVTTPVGGWNNVYSTNTFSCRLVNNSTSTSIPARHIYWGTGSNMYCGPVDYGSPLSSPVNTPSKTMMRGDDGILNVPLYNSETRKLVGWLQTLAQDALGDSSNAINALHTLALYVGPGGRFSTALDGYSWETLLSQIQSVYPMSRKIRLSATALRLQSHLDQGDYNGVSALADQTLALTDVDSDLWLFCQTRKIYASIGAGNLDRAQSILSSIWTRGVGIDESNLKQMEKYLSTIRSTADLNALAKGRQSGEVGVGVSAGYNNLNHALPQRFGLYQNFPNPFNPSTQIIYQVPEEGRVSLVVYNVLGQEVKVLVDAIESAGQHYVTFDGTGIPSGIYFYRLQAGTLSEAKKALLMR